MKAVSIILPVYEVERYVLKCLESINSQTFRDFDVVIVDDCGKDNSIAIAESFLAQTNIDYTIVRNRENLGIATTREIGIETATGNYILFVDPDDWIEKTMLEELYAAAITFEADIVACNGLEIWEKNEMSKRITTVKKGIYTAESYLRHIFNWDTTVCFWLRMFKRDLFAGVSFPKNVVYEDFIVFPYLIENARKIVQIDNTLYNYIRRNDSITLSRPTNIQGYLEKMCVLNAHFKNKVPAIYIIKYNHSLLYFLMFNLFKFSDTFAEVRTDINAIKRYVSLKDLLKMRVGTTNAIWLFALMVKLNGRVSYFLFKRWQMHKTK